MDVSDASYYIKPRPIYKRSMGTDSFENIRRRFRIFK
jgi:hypothetical protein